MRALAAAARWRPGDRAQQVDRERPAPVEWPAADRCRSTNRLRSSSATAFPSHRAGERRRQRRRRTASEVGLPVVVKLDGPAHKSAAGGVVLGVENAEAAAPRGRAPGRTRAGRAQVAPGPEVICGMTRDRDYGPVLAVGARRHRSRGVEARGSRPRPALARRSARARLAGSGPRAPSRALRRRRRSHGRSWPSDVSPSTIREVAEIDVNPLILGEDGAVAVDALIVIEPGAAA